MPEPGAPTDGDEFLRRMRELESRVARLEQRLEATQEVSAPLASAPSQVALVESVAAVPALGRAVLAIAGAYVLRALTEARMLPPKLGVFAGIAYAVFWLVWAARIPAGRRAEAALYSLTSALVLGPLLWESTLRLHELSTWTAAAGLLLFTLIGLLISWRSNLLVVATIALLTGLLTGAALLIGSHDVVPFLLLVLLIATAVEISACLDQWRSERWLAAAAADLVVLLATYLATSPQGLPESYKPIPHWSVVGALLALPAIYLLSAMACTFLRRATFSVFEAGQIGAAFLIGISGGVRLGAMSTGGAALCAACGIACYWAGAWRQGRDSRVYVNFGLLLVSAGIWFGLPAGWAAAAWSGVAMGFMLLHRPVFHWHAAGYLLCGLASSGALAGATRALLGGSDEAGPALVLLGETSVALVCFALAVHAGASHRVLRIALAAASFWLLAGVSAVAVAASYHAVFGALASHAYCAAGRTAVLAGGATLLAWAGSRWNSVETALLIYPTMALAAYRLLLIDLRQDSTSALVISLLVFGAALLLIPRLMKPRQISTG